MELKDFIKETLAQITNGVVEAQELIKNTGAYINPEGRLEGNQVRTGFEGEYRSIQNVKMSIAVKVIENTQTKAALGVVSAFINAGAATANSDSNSVTNRIEFEIPISLPITNVTK
ncbi:hypothetical protein [Paludibacter sp.]|uniref:hypothetical protein n=1 Tax=Paludibacter sp. TaxID=1898105 RepID=UPI0013531508|nr:hypothetical protein [Paludibacter sp.]MTK53358.1 hypothetical protein [Paludibacter sp.]